MLGGGDLRSGMKAGRGEVQEGGNMCINIAQLLHHTAETGIHRWH